MIVMEMKIQFDVNNPKPYVFNPKVEKRVRVSKGSLLPAEYAAVPENKRMELPLENFF